MQPDEDRLWAGLGYAGLPIMMIPTLLILWFKRDESDYIYLNLLQALAFGVLFVIVNVIFQFMVSIPLMGLLVLPAYGLILIVFSLVWLLLTVLAFMGKDVRIPLLTEPP